MTKKQLDDFIEQLNERGICLGLDSIGVLLDKLGNPQKDIDFVHIAGTNGKGSILAYVSTVLKEAGYKVGRYISPVIVDYREKIQVNEKYITKKALYEGMELISDILHSKDYEDKQWPTLFEVETALAFWYFKQCKCDIVVLETGLGGAEDATNIIDHSLVDVFASISRDHMRLLGNTVEDIARVKSGIIKSGSRVVSAPASRSVLSVLLERALALGNTMSAVNPASICNVKYGLSKQTFDYKDYKKLTVTMAGTYQIENAATALEVVLALREKGFKISDKALYDGLKKATWYGRFSVVKKKPLVIVDGAHNEDAAKKLRASMETYLSDKRKIFIMGVLADKEYEKVISATSDLADHIITLTPPNNMRALPAQELARAVQDHHAKVTVADSVEEALEMAYLLGSGECAIIAFGSLSYLGRLKECIESK